MTADAAPAESASAPLLPESLEYTRRLIAFPSIAQTSNLDVIDYIEAEFARHGHTGHRSYSEDGTRANLFITIPAADGTVNGGIIISGHTDVVPVEGQIWDSDPFTVRVEGTRAYGRGVCDMKGYLGAALWLLPRIRQDRLRVPCTLRSPTTRKSGVLGRPPSLRSSHTAAFTRSSAWWVNPPQCASSQPTRVRTAAGSASPGSPNTPLWPRTG